jgi:hypothetical protein
LLKTLAVTINRDYPTMMRGGDNKQREQCGHKLPETREPTPARKEAIADLWQWLNRPNLEPIPDHLVSKAQDLTFSHCLEYFRNRSRFKIINLQAMSGDDGVYLADLGISRRYLARNLGITIKNRHFDSRNFQFTGVRKKIIHAYSPFNGRLLASNQSLLASLNVIFYRFQDQQIFYIVASGIGSGFPKSALYFPQQELIITSGELWRFEKEDVIELQARMVSNAVLCCDYLLDDANRGRKVAICLGFYHFAHHLLNELSGIYKLHSRRLLHHADKYLVMREPLGTLGDVFPEIRPEKIDRRDNTETLFHEVLTNRYFVIKTGDNFLSRDLADRVYRVALRNCVSETIARAADARRRYSPLLWVGIRVGNRSWVNQAEGLSNLIGSLVDKFSRLGVVFDGFSLPGDRCVRQNNGSDYLEILGIENDVVTDIIERLRRERCTPGLFNIIGNSIFEANVWAHAIDFYVSPYGSLQHKVGWLANKPGIIHTNRSLLKRPSKHVWIGVENAIKPRYIDPTAVEDVGTVEKRAALYKERCDRTEVGAGVLASDERAQWNAEFDNYAVDWRMLRQQLIDLIESHQTPRKISLPALADRSLQHVVRTVQSVIDYTTL